MTERTEGNSPHVGSRHGFSHSLLFDDLFPLSSGLAHLVSFFSSSPFPLFLPPYCYIDDESGRLSWNLRLEPRNALHRAACTRYIYDCPGCSTAILRVWTDCEHLEMVLFALYDLDDVMTSIYRCLSHSDCCHSLAQYTLWIRFPTIDHVGVYLACVSGNSHDHLTDAQCISATSHFDCAALDRPGHRLIRTFQIVQI